MLFRSALLQKEYLDEDRKNNIGMKDRLEGNSDFLGAPVFVKDDYMRRTVGDQTRAEFGHQNRRDFGI